MNDSYKVNPEVMATVEAIQIELSELFAEYGLFGYELEGIQ